MKHKKITAYIIDPYECTIVQTRLENHPAIIRNAILKHEGELSICHWFYNNQDILLSIDQMITINKEASKCFYFRPTCQYIYGKCIITGSENIAIPGKFQIVSSKNKINDISHMIEWVHDEEGRRMKLHVKPILTSND